MIIFPITKIDEQFNTFRPLLMRSRNLREKVKNLFDRKVERDHCTSVTSRYAFLYEIILG